MTSSDTIRFICPGCGYRARIPGTFSGKVILCPGCQKVQIASHDGGAATGATVSIAKVATAPDAAAGQVSVADAQGKIRFTCAKCGFHAKLASTYAGKAIACPGCQAPQLIPPLGEAKAAAVGAATSAAPAAAAATGGGGRAAALALEEPAISMDEPTPFGGHELKADEPGDAEAAARPAPKPAAKPAPKPAEAAASRAAAKPAAKPSPTVAARAPELELESGPEISLDAPESVPPSASEPEIAASAPVPAPAPAPKGGVVKRRASAPSASNTPAEPAKGVVRRGGRAGAALAAEEEAAQIAEEEEDAAAEAEELAKSKELPAYLKPYESQIARLREPRVVVALCAGLVAVVLEIMLLVAWRSNANGMVDYRSKYEKASSELTDSTDKLKHVEFSLAAANATVKTAEGKLSDAQGQVAEAQKEVDIQKGKAKQAEAEHQKEYDSRKIAESKLDAALDKLAKAVQARDEDYKKRVDAEKALTEEARLRKELKDKLDELAKAPK